MMASTRITGAMTPTRSRCALATLGPATAPLSQGGPSTLQGEESLKQA